MNRYAVLCPGQGVQHTAMFSLVRNEACFQETLREAHKILGEDLEALAADPSAAYLNRNAQLLIVAAAVSTWRALAPTLPEPSFFAGYSVGELSAYGCAHAIDLRGILALVKQRATLMSEGAPLGSGLVAVRGADYSVVASLSAAAKAHVAIVNGPDRHVVGGTREALARFGAHAVDVQLRLTPLPVDVPAHTPLLQGAAMCFGEVLQASPLQAPQLPVLASIDAGLVITRADAIERLATQLAAPIDWHQCMTSLIERGCRVFLELPPGRVLTQMFHEQFPHIEARAAEDFRTLDAVRDWLVSRLSDTH